MTTWSAYAEMLRKVDGRDDDPAAYVQYVEDALDGDFDDGIGGNLTKAEADRVRKLALR